MHTNLVDSCLASAPEFLAQFDRTESIQIADILNKNYHQLGKSISDPVFVEIPSLTCENTIKDYTHVIFEDENFDTSQFLKLQSSTKDFIKLTWSNENEDYKGFFSPAVDVLTKKITNQSVPCGTGDLPSVFREQNVNAKDVLIVSENYNQIDKRHFDKELTVFVKKVNKLPKWCVFDIEGIIRVVNSSDVNFASLRQFQYFFTPIQYTVKTDVIKKAKIPFTNEYVNLNGNMVRVWKRHLLPCLTEICDTQYVLFDEL